ncbi:NF-kappa-B-repressing factor [Leptinotarsa decemlineata]|uniref:NF-kappa-B-repressing factor n=1 Tax=Leptinotarsa decemlineata TaxID=7539 RepID=UPI003D304EBD
MQRNRNRSFRGNNSNRGMNNKDSRNPWKSNFNDGLANGRGRSNVSPWISDTFNSNNAQTSSNIPSLMSVFIDQNMLNRDEFGGNRHANNIDESFSNQNRPRLNFIPPERNDDEGYYWQHSSQSDNEPFHQKYDFEDNHRGNFRRQLDRSTPYDRSTRERQQRPSRWEHPEEHTRKKREPDLEQELLSPLEVRVEKLMDAVKSQPHGIGELVLLQNNNEIPPVLLHNAAHQVKNCVLAIDRDESTGYSKLLLNGFSVVEGMYSSKKDAKEALYEMGLEVLKDKCFFITSKCHFEEVSMEALAKQKEEELAPAMGLEGSKAHQMMLKMGWGGKGLGTQEQGEQKTVADKIVENITREGLGSQNVMQEVQKILYDYARSNKTTTLGFDSGFTKEERAQIHAIAAKYHLRSKSEGGFNTRRITVSKKKNKWMLVKDLLMVGGENESYSLTIPEEYQDMWKELCKADGVET